MPRIIIAFALGCMAQPALAGLLGPDPVLFMPSIAPDGSRTWSFSMELKAVHKEDRTLPREQRDQKIASVILGWQRYCEKGWVITDSREQDKRLIIEGKCL